MFLNPSCRRFFYPGQWWEAPLVRALVSLFELMVSGVDDETVKESTETGTVVL
jgi:hypothetical protein